MSRYTRYPSVTTEEKMEVDESHSGSRSQPGNNGNDSGKHPGWDTSASQMSHDAIDDLIVLLQKLSLNDTEMDEDQMFGGHCLDAEEMEI